tara:strand:- start:12375 stop:13394 length:1020 start_codon:yes stop_codon:yes gene_type:complete
MTAFRTLMVGFGDIASGLDQDLKMARYFEYASHASVLSAHPAFDWLGTVDLREAALINARDKWRIPVVETDLATAIEKVRPEIAVLATPPGQRAEAVAAMPDLKAVLVEKPLSGPNDNDGKALATICAERGIPVLVNYWRRADRNFRDLAAGGLKARIGAPQAVFGLYGKGLANNCSHMIDFLRMLLGDVTTVQALGPAVPSPDSTVPGDLQLPFALTLEDSTVASFGTVDFHHYREVGLDIWGERGRLSVLLEGLSATFFPVADNRGLENTREVSPDAGEVLKSTVSDSLYRMYDNLAAIAAGTAAPWSSLASALINEKIKERILRSAAEGGARLPVD